MLAKLLKKIVGSRNDRLLKRYLVEVAKINALEAGLQGVSLEALREKTDHLRGRFQAGEGVDTLLVETFALVRELGKRTLNMRHFDVQLLGGIALHEGKIAEMSTGEGKTLVATLPAVLNALTGRSVHIVTVNDYLAKRDCAWMEPLYTALGLTVGVVVPGMTREAKKEAYRKDIIYATNNECGFDYLRDKMVHRPEECVQGDLHYAIVDEVDSILVDEARTPLIISGAAEDSSALYYQMNTIVPLLKPQVEKEGVGDYTLDEKSKQVLLTEMGHEHAEVFLKEAGLLPEEASLYDPANIILMHHLIAALRAHRLYRKDVEYLISNQKVVIVDEHTGRTMPGRRWSDGLHQAIEAKEGVPIESENQTLASITFQNFFRMYTKLSGMTGTADTEAYEFHQIYGLEVVVVPPNRKSQRRDLPDMVYLTTAEKFAAIVQEIKKCVQEGRPVLVGTISIETSEYLSEVLSQNKVPHQVLNAKFHEQEARIIAEAGRPKAVTIATNMAGRGTDIVLGGSLDAELKALSAEKVPTQEEIEAVKRAWQERHACVVQAGGLHILGTERHESRRVDNQLRGRAGRQGDPGSTQFFLALQDNLMRIFASDRVTGLMRKLGVQQGEAITHPWVTSAIENAQRKVESYNFDIRKQLLEYDNVANDQRQAFYEQRDELLMAEDIQEGITRMRKGVLQRLVHSYIPSESLEEAWDVSGLQKCIATDFALEVPITQWVQEAEVAEVVHRLEQTFEKVYQQKETEVGASVMRRFEKVVMLHALDQHWKEHLAAMDYLRQSIHLRGYAQKDPRQEFKREAFALFTDMLEHIKYDTIKMMTQSQFQIEEPRREALTEPVLEYHHSSLADVPQAQVNDKVVNSTISRVPSKKVGRNEPCPCGSGKKYKACHGVLQ